MEFWFNMLSHFLLFIPYDTASFPVKYSCTITHTHSVEFKTQRSGSWKSFILKHDLMWTDWALNPSMKRELSFLGALLERLRCRAGREVGKREMSCQQQKSLQRSQAFTRVSFFQEGECTLLGPSKAQREVYMILLPWQSFLPPHLLFLRNVKDTGKLNSHIHTSQG